MTSRRAARSSPQKWLKINVKRPQSSFSCDKSMLKDEIVVGIAIAKCMSPIPVESLPLNPHWYLKEDQISIVHHDGVRCSCSLAWSYSSQQIVALQDLGVATSTVTSRGDHELFYPVGSEEPNFFLQQEVQDTMCFRCTMFE